VEYARLSCDLPGQSAPSDFSQRRGPGILIGAAGEYPQRYGFRIYAYGLVSNQIHYSLLIETGEFALSKIMQGVQL